ncbi:calcium-binding protein [Neptuniibacter sp. PT8_73]|uniref:calcium-binding protein n=1 Tax=Neptuniibacter sp. PT8_73 TaxID=3398206 RepID=UPI0039F52BB9
MNNHDSKNIEETNQLVSVVETANIDDSLFPDTQYIYGTEDNDALKGSEASDAIWGYGGADFLDGGEGDDHITGGKGDDYLKGGAGSDTYYFNRGDGMDTISDVFPSGSDKLVFGEGILREHVEVTSSENDIVLNIIDPSGIETDRITLSAAFYSSTTSYRIETVLFADGTTLTHEEMYREAQKVTGTEADDSLMGTSQDDYIFGYEGDDLLVGDRGSDQLTGGIGNDRLEGGGDADTYFFNRGDGQDVIADVSTIGADKLILGEGILLDQVKVERSGDDIVLTISDPEGIENDRITIEGAFVSTDNSNRIEILEFSDGTQITHDEIFRAAREIHGSSADDFLKGSSVRDYIYGYNGNDTLVGGGGHDHITGGKGNDRLEGGEGGDTYYFKRGDGHDVISDNSASGVDKLILGAGILREQLIIARDGNDMVLAFLNPEGEGDSVTIENAYLSTNTANRLETIIFSDGSELSFEDYGEIKNIYGTELDDSLTGDSSRDYLFGYEGSDLLKGESGADHLSGGRGDDRLEGGDGSDTYYFNRGDGFDVIVETSSTGEDRIVFGEGILLEHVTVSRNEFNIILDISDPEGVATDQITLENAFLPNSDSFLNLSVQFFDGTEVTHNDIFREAKNVYGTDADDHLIGSHIRDYMFGAVGDDHLEGNGGADHLAGGKGDDRLDGGDGNDTYYFNRGDGYDIIREVSSSDGDTLVLGEGILREHVTITNNSFDIFLDIVDPDGVAKDRIALASAFTSFSPRDRIEAVKFFDGTVMDHDEMFREAQNKFGTDGDDHIVGSILEDYMFGYAGDDTLIGDSKADHLTGGEGNDRLEGGTGGDSYYFEKGFGNDVILDLYQHGIDKLIFGEGINPDHVTIARTGYDIVMSVNDVENDSSDSVTLEGIFSYGNAGKLNFEAYFADGTKFTSHQIFSEALNMHGTDGNDSLTGSILGDHIFGYEGNDALQGKKGEDVLVGGKGNDLLEGGEGSDTYLFNRGDGWDVVWDKSDIGTDKIIFGEGITKEHLEVTHSGVDLVLEIADPHGQASDRIIIESALLSTSPAYRIEIVEFSDGSQLTHDDLVREAHTLNGGSEDDTLIGSWGADYLFGNTGDDLLMGQEGTDFLTGGMGNDVLEGGIGSDTYYFNTGDGQDTVRETVDSWNDQIIFSDDLLTENIWFSRVEDNLQIDFSGVSDQINIENWYVGRDHQVEQFKVADSVLDYSKIDALVQAMAVFDAPVHAGEIILQEVKDQLQPVLAASWQPIS